MERVMRGGIFIYRRGRTFFRLLTLFVSLSPKQTMISLSITIINGFFPILLLMILRSLIDQISNFVSVHSNSMLPAFCWAFLLIFCSIIQQTMSRYGEVIQEHAQEHLKEKIQRNIILKTQSLSLAEFERPTLYDQLVRVQNGLDQRLFSTMLFISRIFTRIITVTSLTLFLWSIDWTIPVILTVGTVIFTVIRIRPWYEKYIIKRKQTSEERRLDYLSNLMTSREAAREVRLFDLGSHLLKTWHKLNYKLSKERLTLSRREFIFELVSSIGINVCFGCVLIIIVILGIKGEISAGQYAAFITAIMQFQNDLRGLFWEIALVNNDMLYIQDFFDYMDLPEDNKVGLYLTDEPLKHGIMFESVSFKYPGSPNYVLKGINLHIRPGERIALIGDNGAGKTTFVKLLLGLYRPTEGRILIDGKNLNEINLSSWRRKATAILQDFQRYESSVNENIAIGHLSFINDGLQVRKAAIKSGTHEMIMDLKDGYQTQLGKRFDGVDLSQGQWQRLAIARAYLRKSEVLILDEPTSSLDPKAEIEVYRQFQDASKEKTVILISHRLGSAKLADRIIVLHDGIISEEGRHEDLMALYGYYATMFGIQSQWYD